MLDSIANISIPSPKIPGEKKIRHKYTKSDALRNVYKAKIDKITKEINTETLYDINHNLIRFKHFIKDSNIKLQ